MNERQLDKILREKYPFIDSSKGERDANKFVVDQLAESNVLNSYRSITYNFTLAGLKKGYLSDPKKYRDHKTICRTKCARNFTKRSADPVGHCGGSIRKTRDEYETHSWYGA
jgi:hypothetical protein